MKTSLPVLALPLFLLAACDRSAAPAAAASVVVADAWCRAAPTGALSGGCYVTLTASSDDRFVAVTTTAAERGEIHTMDMSGGVMRMRKLDDGLALPAGQAVALKPGAEHIMVIGPKQPLNEGSSVPLTLTFEKAPPQTIEAPVRTAPAAGHEGGH